MRIEDLTDEQIAKARECKSTKELIALAGDLGVELTEEQLDAVTGGDTEWGLCWAECSDQTCNIKCSLDTFI